MRAVLMIGALMLAACQPAGVPLYQYQKVKTDMHLWEVRDMIEQEPVQVVQTVVQLSRPYGFRDLRQDKYVWRMVDGGRMTVMFSDMLVVSKEIDAAS